MWLINTSTLDMKEFSGSGVPKYAILSHTWGEEEVLFHDMPQSRTNMGQEARLLEASRKKGYAKIKNACITARELHYDYVWVDTCCIDKSVEQMEEINSMFRYYEEAGICLAYLSDVSPEPDSILGALSFARWFTRGWTLQELLAPWNITFYSSDWSEIGTRTTLSKYIERITGIDRRYLWDQVGYSTRFDLLREASVAQRMTWAVGRNTTKPEDIAYCLLGIFGIQMSLMYGEGSRAFIRLQEHIIARYSDATLLAWNARTIPGSEIIPPEEPEDPSRWRATWKMLTWKEHPWGSLERMATNLTPSLSLLAPSPDYFIGCQDVVAHDIFFDWSVTSGGIRLCLPTSGDMQPYIVLPCYMSSNPLNLLAIKLVRQESEGLLHARGCAPLKQVPYCKWHQWSRQDLLLRTGVVEHLRSPSSLLLEEHHILLEFPYPQVRLQAIFTNSMWRSLESLKCYNLQVPIKGRFPWTLCYETLRSSAFLFEDIELQSHYALVIRYHQTWSFPFFLGCFPTQCRRIRLALISAATRQAVQELVLNDTDWDEPAHLDIKSMFICTAITQDNVLGRDISSITLRRSRTGPGVSLSRLWHKSMFRLSRLVGPKYQQLILSFDAVFSFSPGVNFILACLLWYTCMMPLWFLLYRWPWPTNLFDLDSTLDALDHSFPLVAEFIYQLSPNVPYLMGRLQLFIISLMFALQLLPLASNYSPHTSPFLKKHYLTIASVFGVAAVLKLHSETWVFFFWAVTVIQAVGWEFRRTGDTQPGRIFQVSPFLLAATYIISDYNHSFVSQTICGALVSIVVNGFPI